MNIKSFISTCQDFIHNPHASAMCYQFMADTMANLSGLQESLGALHPQERPEDAFLFRSANLFIFNSFLIPNLISPPHNHGTWAVVGVYEGQEDNIFYTRNNGHLAETGRKRLTPGEVVLLETDTIHGVSNPLPQPSLALHVYGADLFSTHRSMWNPWTMQESCFEINQFLTFSLTMMQQRSTSHAKSQD